MFEVYEAVADAVADAIDEYGWWLDGPLAYPLQLDQDVEWARHCSAYRMLCWADQSPEHYNEAQWAAMDEEHRIALRKKIMATPPDKSMSQEVRDLRHMVVLLKEQIGGVSNSVASHVEDHDEMVEKRLERLVERGPREPVAEGHSPRRTNDEIHRYALSCHP